MYGPDEVPEDVQSKTSMPVYRFDEFVKLGASVCDLDLEACEESQKPNEITTLIYTSGMTGPPKAAMITHDYITWTAKAQLSTLVRPLDNDDHIISYLPLSHIAAQQLDKSPFANWLPNLVCSARCIALESRSDAERCSANCLFWCTSSVRENV